MFLDNLLSFNTAVNSSQTISATANSTTVIDVTGAGSGNAPAMINGFPATNTAIGVDYGIGEGMAVPYVVVVVTTATTVTGTLTIALQSAPDNGSYSPGSYTTLFTSPALTGATQLYAGSVYYFPVPPTPLAQAASLPRFYRLNYTVGSSINVVVNSFITFNVASFAGAKPGLLGGTYAANFIAG